MPRATRFTTATSLAAVLCALQPATAQEAFTLDEITVFSNLTPTEREAVGASVSIATGEEIAAAGDAQLSDYLDRLPGISVAPTGPRGAQTALRIRGAHQRYVAVYVDGVLVNDPASPASDFNFGTLSTADIGRVEVLRGSQSALYGASAVGGVINITTHSAEQEGTTQSATVEAGSHETFNGRYSFTNRGPDGQVSATLSHVTTEGFSAASAGDERDGFDATRLSFSARHRLSESLSVGASAFVQRSRSEYDDWPNDADFVEHRDELGARLFAEYDAGAATHEFELTGYRVDREDDSADFLGNPVTDEFEGRRLGARYLGSAPVNDGLTLSWGAEIGRETVEAPDFDTQREATRGVFAEAQWAPRTDLDISASARLDDHSDFDTHSTARLAAAWRPSEALTLRGAVSNGYRVPAAAERFGPFGNPDLEAETSRSAEIGAEYAFAGGAAISGTAFWLETDDEVTFGPPPGFTPDNIERTRRRGLELAGTLPLGERVTLDAAYTYLDAEVTGGPNSGDRLLRVPGHDLSLSLGAEVTERLSGTFTVQHVADRHDVRIDFSRGPVPDYTVAHANFRYTLSDAADLTLRVENVLDERYERVAGYGTSGRAVYLGLSSRF